MKTSVWMPGSFELPHPLPQGGILPAVAHHPCQLTPDHPTISPTFLTTSHLLSSPQPNPHSQVRMLLSISQSEQREPEKNIHLFPPPHLLF